ncbi:hypothetical protein [Homoserinimonas hongtaonis]|uniref:hypothetical protein n=1 Tax=Homoserinimonas hongtaonis TaxID=2079791 RepID=UPI000D365C12|nr:hypothetical protein [Salinibacterium hongtaonis]AWB89613.1 hypothetical protein C2138_08720 [Salinibacterium hongtaonis]
MSARRLFVPIIFGAAIVLPLWLILARAFILRVDDWQIPLVTLSGVALGVCMAIVATVTWFRKSVREGGGPSAWDLGLLSAWYLSIILAGVVEHGAISIPVILLGLAAFWSAVWQLLSETKRRVQSAIDTLEISVPSAQEYRRTHPRPDAPLAGQVIRIDPPEV